MTELQKSDALPLTGTKLVLDRICRVALFLPVVCCLMIVLTGRPNVTAWERSSFIGRVEFALADQMEQGGQIEAAGRLYQGVLERIPEKDRQWRSRTHFRLGDCFWRLGAGRKAFENFQKAASLDPSNLDARLRVGGFFLAGGAGDMALEQGQALLNEGHRDPETLALTGAAALVTGRIQLAETSFRGVLAEHPGRIPIAMSLSEILTRERRPDEARIVLQAASQAQPESAIPLQALARLEEQSGNIAAAEAAYRQAVAREDSPAANLQLAQFLVRTSRKDEAEVVLRRVDAMQPSRPAALADFEWLSGDGRSALSRYLLSMRSVDNSWLTPRDSSQDRELHVAMAARIIEADLVTPPPSRDVRQPLTIARQHFVRFRKELDPATTAMLQAEIDLAANEVTAAEFHGKTAVELAPKSAAATYVLGVAQYRGGATTEAQNSWLQALEFDRDYVPARLALAQMELQYGDMTGAGDRLRQLVRDEPENLQALVLYGRLLLALGDVTASQSVAQRALAIDHGSREAQRLAAEIDGRQGATGPAAAARPSASADSLAEPGTAGVLAGVSAEQRGDTAEAIRQYESALREGEHSGVAANNLAWLYAVQGIQLDRALTLAEKADALMPGNPDVLDTMGFVYLRRREYSEAITILHKAATLPASAGQADLAEQIHKHLAEARVRAGISADEIEVAAVREQQPAIAHPKSRLQRRGDSE